MMAGRKIKTALMAACALLVLLAGHSAALAQCAMCKTGVTGSPDATRLAESLNFAIIILLIPPVLIFCAIFYAAFRQRKSRETSGLSAGSGRWRRLWREKLSSRSQARRA
jgi:hypothetical protein